MAAPLVVSFVMRAAFTLVDTAYAATIGDAAVAAVGLTVPFEFSMIAVWVGLSTGLTSCLSRAMGERAQTRIAQYLRSTWILVLLLAPLFLLVGVLIWGLAPRMRLDAEVAASFRIYGSVLVGGSALTFVWSVIPDSIVKAHQDTRSTMWAGIWSNVINVALNTLFTFVFHWGVFGIALSTVVGRIGGLAYALARAGEHERRRLASTTQAHAEADPSPYRSLLTLAVPAALTFGLMATENALVNAFLARGAFATEAIAAYSIYYRVVLFALNPVFAAGVAMLPYAARRVGEGDEAGLRRGVRHALAASAVYTLLVVAPVVVLGAGWIAGSLASSPTTAGFTRFALRLAPWACLAAAPFLLCRPVLEGMGRGRPGLAMAILRYGILTPPALWLGGVVASSRGASPLGGVLWPLLGTSALSSILFLLWLRRALRVWSAGRSST